MKFSFVFLKGRDFLKNVSVLGFGTLIGSALAFFSQLLLARILGAEDFGYISSALAILNILSPIVGFGASLMWLQVAGQDGVEEVRKWIGPSLRFSNFSALLLFICIFIFYLISQNIGLYLLILFPVVLAQAYIGFAISKGQLAGDYRAVAMWNFLPHFYRVIFLIGGALVPGILFDADMVAIGFLFISLCIYLYIKLDFSKMQNAPGGFFYSIDDFSGSRVNVSIADVVRRSWRFGLDGLIYLMYYQVGAVIVYLILGAEVAGLFNLAFVFISAATLLPGVIYQKYLMPKIHYWVYHDVPKIVFLLRKASVCMFFLGCLVSIFLAVIGEGFIKYFIGAEYSDSMGILYILLLCLPVKYAAAGASAILTTSAFLSRKLKVTAASTLAFVFLNISLCYCFGVTGGAISIVVVEFVVGAAFYCIALNGFVSKKNG